MPTSQESLLELIKLHRRNLSRLQEQQALYGALHTPVHILVEIEDIEAELQALEQKLELISSGQDVKSGRDITSTSKKEVEKDVSGVNYGKIGILGTITLVITILIGIFSSLLANQLSEAFASLGEKSGIIELFASVVAGLSTIIIAVYLFYMQKANEKQEQIKQIRDKQKIVTNDEKEDSAGVEGNL